MDYLDLKIHQLQLPLLALQDPMELLLSQKLRQLRSDQVEEELRPLLLPLPQPLPHQDPLGQEVEEGARDRVMGKEELVEDLGMEDTLGEDLDGGAVQSEVT